MKPIFKCLLLGVFFCGVAASLMAQVANVPPTITPVSSGLSIRENDFVQVAIYAPTDIPNDGDGDTPLQIVWDFESDPTGQATFLTRTNDPVQTITDNSTSTRVALTDSGGNAVGQTIKARVSVSDGIDTSTFTFDIPVTGVNHAPELIVDQSGLGTLTNPILEGSGFGVNASQSRDPDGGTVKFFWSIKSVSGPTTCAGGNGFVLQGYYGANPGFVVPQMRSTPANPTRVTIEARVEDGLIVVTQSFTGYIASVSGNCVTNPPGGGGNTAPLVSAAANPQHASFNQSVSLIGTASDPGDTLSYSWVQLSATTGSPVVISGSSSQNASFTAPSTASFLTFRFTATDSGGLSRSRDVTVQVSATGGSGSGGGGGGGNATGTPSGTASGTAVCTGLASQGGTNQAAHGTVPATYTIEGGNQADISVTGGVDPDGTTVTVGGAGTISGVTYQWDVVDSGGGLFLGLTGTQTATVHFDVPVVTTQRTGRLRVAVNDPVNCGTNYEVNVVVIPPTNNPSNNNPTANLRYSVQGTSDEGLNPSAAITLSPPIQITLTADESTDPDGDSLTYGWNVNPVLAGVTLSQGTTSRTLTVVEGVTGNVTVTLSVNDGNGGNVSRAVTFQFQPPTDKPVMAQAAILHNGEAVTGAVGPGMVLVLSGAQSSVIDGTTEENNGLTFLWQQTGGPPAFTRSLASRDAEIVVEGITETTNLTFRLTARNGTAVGTTDVSLSVDPALAEPGGEDDSGPLYFARVGFGPVQGLEFQTLLVLDNRSAEDADDTLIEFFDSEGQPLEVRYLDNSVTPAEFRPWDSSEPFLVGAQSSRVLEFQEAEGAGISFGWAKVTSAHRLRGSIRFQLVDLGSGDFLSDVGILSSPVGSEFQAAFRNQDNLAFAISNPDDQLVHVKVKVERLSGGAFEDVLEIPPGGHSAQFLSDFFTFVNLEAIREGTLRLQVMESGQTIVATVLITRDSLAVSSQSFARVR